MAQSYNGWPASSSASAIGVNTRWEPIPGVRFPGGVKAGDVQTIFDYLVRQLNARVEKAAEYRAGDDWGWNYRVNVNNPSTLSCHASATAIDYNATQHPNRVKYTWSAAQVRTIHTIINSELDGVIKWLEGYDEMHFEIRGSAATVHAVAEKIRRRPATAPAPTAGGRPVFRIVWFKNSKGVVSAYRCGLFWMENSKKWIVDEATWIKDPAELKIWRGRGVKDHNTGATPAGYRPSIRYYNGPMENTPTV